MSKQSSILDLKQFHGISLILFRRLRSFVGVLRCVHKSKFSFVGLTLYLQDSGAFSSSHGIIEKVICLSQPKNGNKDGSLHVLPKLARERGLGKGWVGEIKP